MTSLASSGGWFGSDPGKVGRGASSGQVGSADRDIRRLFLRMKNRGEHRHE